MWEEYEERLRERYKIYCGRDKREAVGERWGVIEGRYSGSKERDDERDTEKEMSFSISK